MTDQEPIPSSADRAEILTDVISEMDRLSLFETIPLKNIHPILLPRHRLRSERNHTKPISHLSIGRFRCVLRTLCLLVMAFCTYGLFVFFSTFLAKQSDTISRPLTSVSANILYLTVRGDSGILQTIQTTDTHPFWVVADTSNDLRRVCEKVTVETARDGPLNLYHANIDANTGEYYVEVSNLQVGGTFIGSNGEQTSLFTTHREERLEGISVYNFEVDGTSNCYIITSYEAYLAGTESVLVHHAGCSDVNGRVYRLQNGSERVMRTGQNRDLVRRKSEHKQSHPTLNFITVGKTDEYAVQRGLEYITNPI